MIRKALLASALAASPLLMAPAAQASVNFGTISGIVNQLHNNSHFSSNNMSFSTEQNGQSHTLFTGVTGLHDFLNSPNGLNDFNNWATQGSSGGTGSGNSYHFTYTVLSSYFGHQTGGPTGGTNDNRVQTMSFRTDIAAIPEPASWTLMIVGFGVIGIALRRRRRTETNFA